MNQRSKFYSIFPFVIVAMGWPAIAAIYCADDPSALKWMLVFWSLCVLDLAALAGAVVAFIALAAGGGKNRGALIIQAFTWGALKLACVGIFAAIFLQDFAIPTRGFSGLGTLMIVPLAGGLWWSQRELRHASRV